MSNRFGLIEDYWYSRKEAEEAHALIINML